MTYTVLHLKLERSPYARASKPIRRREKGHRPLAIERRRQMIAFEYMEVMPFAGTAPFSKAIMPTRCQ